jgi:hypothetical protein
VLKWFLKDDISMMNGSMKLEIGGQGDSGPGFQNIASKIILYNYHFRGISKSKFDEI